MVFIILGGKSGALLMLRRMITVLPLQREHTLASKSMLGFGRHWLHLPACKGVVWI